MCKFSVMTHGILKFSVFVTLTLTINLLIYHVLTSLTPSLSGPDLEADHEAELARNLLSPPLLERLVSTLARVSALPPRVRPRTGCVAPALQSVACEAHTGLTGNVIRRKTEKKIHFFTKTVFLGQQFSFYNTWIDICLQS